VAGWWRVVFFFGKVSSAAFVASLRDTGRATWTRDGEIFSSSSVIRAPYRGVILATG
jgi:hypothetical protein